MEFRPCIDLRNGKVTQIVGSTLKDSSTQFDHSSSSSSSSSDVCTENFTSTKPSSYYSSLYASNGLHGGHIIMLGSGNELSAREALESTPNLMQIGGGINIDNCVEWLSYGATHVIVTSYVFNQGKIDYEKLKSLVKLIGKNKLVLDLSCRRKPIDQQPKSNQSSNSQIDKNYYVVTNRWQSFTSLPVNEQTLNELSQYCDEFLIHGVDVEGKQQGIEIDLLSICNKSPIPITYAGGIRSLDDIETIYKIGNNKVHCSIGSALDLFGGKLEFNKVIEYCKQKQ